VGVNLASLDFYDTGQVYKNLVGEDNFGFENTYLTQTWALKAAGTTTSFCATNQYVIYPINFFVGASVVSNEGATAGYSGTIIANTAGDGSSNPPCYTVTPAASSAFAAGDQINIAFNQFPTTESCWETNGACGIWGDLNNGGKILTDSTTNYNGDGGKQSAVLDVTAGTSATSEVVLYFDSDTANYFVLLNGTYEVSLWARLKSGSNSNLVVAAGVPGSPCSFSITPTSTWTQYTHTCSFSETNTTSRNSAPVVSAAIAGSDGLGQVEIDHMSFVKTSSQDSTNNTPFRDEFVSALRQFCATSTPGPPCIIRNWTSQNGETMANWTLPLAAASPTQASAGALTYGNPSLQLYDYLNLVRLVGAIPYIEFPVSSSNADAANMIEYLSSTNTSSGYGQVRANQGQSAPWVGTGGVFPDVYLSFCNECWNDSSFSGQDLPWRSAESTDFYHDYWNRAKDVYAAMRADAYFNSSIHLGFNLQLAVNVGSGGLENALVGMKAVGGSPDYVEQAPYRQDTVSDYQTDAALWGSAFVEPYQDVAGNLSGFQSAVSEIQGYNYCGATGTAACAATVYEEANNTLSTCGIDVLSPCTGGTNTAITQAAEDAINAGGAQGVISALQAALNQQYLGITAQNYFGATEYTNNTRGNLAFKGWGFAVDYGGATSYLNNESYSMRPPFFGLAVLNQAIIGPEYSCNLASGPIQNWAGDAYNGPTVAQSNVPIIYPMCYENTSTNQRSIVFFNTSLTASYPINFTGTNTPTGTCSIEQYAPSSPDLLNEAAGGSRTATTPATTSISTSSSSCGTTVTLPPDSETAVTYTISSTLAATPTFSPAAGSYAAVQSVTISDATSGATIYYTTDGSTPTVASSVYSTPIPVALSRTLKAIAIVNGYQTSAVGTASYTITLAEAPTFSVSGGTYNNPPTVTISDITPGTSVYYTTNGTTPTTSSTRYTAPIAITSSCTLKAIAAESGFTSSSVTSATYTLAALSPTISPAAGTYPGPLTVTMNTGSSGVNIYYTTSGSSATTGSPVYTAPITISASEQVYAIAGATGWTQSAQAGAYYTIEPYTATPTFSPAAGTYNSTQTVSISDATSGATIYYTTNGIAPTTSSSVYSGPITVGATETVKAFAVASGHSNSAVGSAGYTLQVLAPGFYTTPGTYTSSVNVQMYDNTSGAAIYYTTDGSTPTTSSPQYSSYVTVSSTETIKAIGALAGYSTSSVTSGTFTIAPYAAQPTLSLSSGTYSGTQTLTISDTTPGAVIYYTVGGVTPTTTSTLYTGPITISSSEYIEAIAVASGYTNSFVAAANYTID
jgi:hypothetical protein